MTTKRTPKNRGLNYWWNEFLFARELEYETEQTPQEVAASLAQLQGIRQKSFLLGDRQNTFERTDHSEKAVDFKFVSDRVSWGESTGTSIQTQGNIKADPNTGMTIITGRVRFAPISQLVLGGWLLLVFWQFYSLVVLEDLIWATLLSIVLVLAWWYLYEDRNSVADELDDAIMNAKSQAASHNLQEVVAEDGDLVDNYANEKKAQYLSE